MRISRIVTILFGLNLSFGGMGSYSILSAEDWAIEVENSEHAALHTVDYKLNSFLRWWCFPSKDVEQILCEGEELGPVETCEGECTDDHYTTVAQIALDGSHRRFEWSVPVFGRECLERSKEWSALVADSPSACFFAAAWPPADPDHWVIYGVKTTSGRVMAPRYDPDYEDVGDDPEDPSASEEIDGPEQE